MQVGERFAHLLVEGLEADILVSTPLGVNGRRDRERVGQLQSRSRTNRRRSSREIHVHLDRLDPEPDEHPVHGLSALRTRCLEGANEYFRVVDGGDEPARFRLERPPDSLDGIGVVGVVPGEERNQDVGVEDDYRHSRRSSSR